MSQFAKDTQSTVIPCLRYRDPLSAIEWLCDTFGFEQHLVAVEDDGRVTHAQLRFGNGMIMLGSVQGDGTSEFGKLMAQPDEIGGAETQSTYLIAKDPDALYERAKAAGAKIAIDIRNEAHGGRDFSCYDPEGHLWNFGSYDPW